MMGSENRKNAPAYTTKFIERIKVNITYISFKNI